MQQNVTYYSSYSATDFSVREPNSSNQYDLDSELLKTLLQIQAPSRNEHDIQMFLIDWIYKNIPTAQLKVDEVGNLLVTKRTTEEPIIPAFAAHMDEVNSLQTDRLVLDLGNVMIGVNRKTGKPAGCPGDKMIVSLCSNT